MAKILMITIMMTICGGRVATPVYAARLSRMTEKIPVEPPTASHSGIYGCMIQSLQYTTPTMIIEMCNGSRTMAMMVVTIDDAIERRDASGRSFRIRSNIFRLFVCFLEI